jgi:hypothetical protein
MRALKRLSPSREGQRNNGVAASAGGLHHAGLLRQSGLRRLACSGKPRSPLNPLLRSCIMKRAKRICGV